MANQAQACFFAYKGIHTGNPPYLADLLQSTSSQIYKVHMLIFYSRLLDVPRHNLSFGSPAF